jgi:hypothetical protein
MFKAYRGTHFTTWFHWNSQGFEICARGGKKSLCSTEQRGRKTEGEKGAAHREKGRAVHKVAGGSPPRRGDRRWGRKLPEREQRLGREEKKEPGLRLGQGKIF